MENIYNPTGTVRYATVTAVDLVRGVCKCIGYQDEIYTNVRWGIPVGGSSGTGQSTPPMEGDNVLVDISTGAPIITGSILSDSAGLLKRPNIAKQDVDEEDIADYTDAGINDARRGPGTPRDQRVGDQVFTSDGGGLFGLLRGGSFVAKASSLSQIILSRFGDLFRTVSRNAEHFTDVDSTYKTSIRGNVYTLREIYRNPERSRTEKPSLTRLEGNVAMGETIGKGYASITADAFPTAPGIADDADVISKEYTHNDDDATTSTRTLDVHGKEYREVVDPADAAVNVKFTSDKDGFEWSKDDKVKVKGDATGVIIDADGQATITIAADGTLTVNTAGACNMTYGGATTIDVTGDLNMSASGNMNLSATTINLN